MNKQPKYVHLCCLCWKAQGKKKKKSCAFSKSLFCLLANQYLSFFDIEFPVHKITVIRLLVYVFVSDLIAHAKHFYFLENVCISASRNAL